MKFGSTLHCRAQLYQTPAEQQQKLNTTSASISAYIATQPAHVQCLLGNLRTTEVNADYWMSVINVGTVTIATDSSVAGRNGFFATVLHTDKQTLHFQGPCDGPNKFMTLY
eukprot:14654745-Ditylum_brightwellii.AAC.1